MKTAYFKLAQEIPFQHENKDTFVISFDLETTGLSTRSSNPARIIQLGGTLFSTPALLPMTTARHFNMLAGLGKDEKLDPKITQITGITDDDLALARPLDTVLQEFVKWVDTLATEQKWKEVILVAHNCFMFDKPLLLEWMRRHQVVFVQPVYFADSLPLCKSVKPEKPHTLAKMLEFFWKQEDQKCPEQVHQALDDTLALDFILRSIAKHEHKELLDKLFHPNCLQVLLIKK